MRLDQIPTDLEQLIEWSVEWEQSTGWDSIPTIERVYDITESGAFMCVFPGCHFARRDAIEMWRHVHFARKHRIPRGSKFDQVGEPG